MRNVYSSISLALLAAVFASACLGKDLTSPASPKLCVSTNLGEQCSTNTGHNSLGRGNHPNNISDISSFHPGHWIKVADPSVSYMTSLMDKIEGTNIRGIEIWHRWDRLELDSPGDYSGKYWDQLDGWMKQAESKGLSIFIRIRTHVFASGGDPYTPDYMKTNSLYGGSPGVYGSYCSTKHCGLRPAWHDPETVARAKALVNEFKRRWGVRDNFEGVGLQESSPGPNAGKTPSWNPTAHADGIVSIMSYAKKIMPNKTALPNINWHPSMSHLLSELATAGIGLSCPDSPPDNSNPNMEVTKQMRSRHFNEDHSPGVSGGKAGTLGNGWTMRQVYDRAANDLNVWRIVWDDEWLGEGLLAFAEDNEIPAADAFYNP